VGGWQVDDQLKLGRLHYREVGRLGTLEDFAGVDAPWPAYTVERKPMAWLRVISAMQLDDQRPRENAC
jgi:hypothetical protein